MVDFTMAYGAVRIAVIVISCIVVGGIAVAGVYAYMMWKRYQEYRVVIWEKDSLGNTHEVDDQGAVFPDRKTGNILFHLRKHKTVLSPDDIPFVLKGKTKLVYIVKYGLRDYRFLRPNVTATDVGMVVGEKDINWAVNTYQRVKKVLEGNNLLTYMPFILIAFVSICILIIFMYLFKQVPAMKEMAEAFRDAAQAFSQCQAAAQVVN